MLSAWLPVAAYVALIFKLSSIPSIDTKDAVTNLDKLVHFVEYGILGGVLARGLARSGLGRPAVRILVTLVAGAALAGADEFFQGTVGRTTSLADWSVDAVAVLAAACVDAWLRGRGRDPHWLWRDDGMERTNRA